jgi:hypothetical protein
VNRLPTAIHSASRCTVAAAASKHDSDYRNNNSRDEDEDPVHGAIVGLDRA